MTDEKDERLKALVEIGKGGKSIWEDDFVYIKVSKNTKQGLKNLIEYVEKDTGYKMSFDQAIEMIDACVAHSDIVELVEDNLKEGFWKKEEI